MRSDPRAPTARLRGREARPAGSDRPPAGRARAFPCVSLYTSAVPDRSPLPDVLAIAPRTTPLDGAARPPGSKSYTNRALVLAALADGRSTIEGALFSDDTRHMAGGVASLGVRVVSDEASERFEVDGCAGKPTARHASVFVGNSGTTARFLTPVLALGTGSYDLHGDEAMARRPIAPAPRRPRQPRGRRRRAFEETAARRFVSSRPGSRGARFAWPAGSAASTSAPC